MNQKTGNDCSWVNYQETVHLIGRKWAGALLDAAMDGKISKVSLCIIQRFTPSRVVDFSIAKEVNEIVPLKIITKAYKSEKFGFLIQYISDLEKEYSS